MKLMIALLCLAGLLAGRLVYPDGICRKNGKGDASDCGIATII